MGYPVNPPKGLPVENWSKLKHSSKVGGKNLGWMVDHCERQIYKRLKRNGERVSVFTWDLMMSGFIGFLNVMGLLNTDSGDYERVGEELERRINSKGVRAHLSVGTVITVDLTKEPKVYE